MRRPRGSFGHMTARQTSLDDRLGVHKTLGPPGPTHANLRARQTVAPAPQGLDPWCPRRLGVAIDFVELYGQIAAFQPRGVRNLRFMLICCRGATGIRAAQQHLSKSRKASPGARLPFSADARV